MSPQIQFPLVFGLVLGFSSGCATVSRDADAPRDVNASRASAGNSNSFETPSPTTHEATSRLLQYKINDQNGVAPLLASESIPMEQVQERKDDSARTPDESLFSWDYLKSIALDTKETFIAPAHWDSRDWLVFSGVSAAIVTTGIFDKDIQEAVQRNRSATSDQVFDNIRPFGAEYSFAVLGGFYLGGEVFHDSRAKSVALDGLTASIIASGLITQPLKMIVGRDRPPAGDGPYGFEPFGGDQSFPSGEATQAFAVASVISQHYDSIWVSCASYGLASLVGYARMNENGHWASDVLAGAAIGTFVGHVVVHFNEHHRHYALVPILGPGMQGVQIAWAF